MLRVDEAPLPSEASIDTAHLEQPVEHARRANNEHWLVLKAKSAPSTGALDRQAERSKVVVRVHVRDPDARNAGHGLVNAGKPAIIGRRFRGARAA